MIRQLLPTLIASVGLIACQPRSPAGLSAADQQAVRAAEQKNVEAIRAKDWPTFAAAFTEHGAILPPNSPAIEGRPAIQAWAEAFPRIADFQSANVALDGQGTLAYTRGTYAMNVVVSDSAPPVLDRGKYLTIWQKQADGTWQVAQDMFNSDLPPAAP